jgi:lysophospholipase L1-like esterase
MDAVLRRAAPAMTFITAALRRLTAASVALAVVSWVLLAIRGQFQVGWLNGYEGPLDALFDAGLAGIALGWSAERWGASRVTPVALRVAVVGVATLATLVVTEFGLRYVFRDVYSSADGRTFFAHRGGPSIRANALGFREREIGAKASGRYRIAIVGDSFTWGQGIEERERFSDVLEVDLGPPYEVLNFGIPGNNLPEHVHVIEQALKVSADFVLLQLYINDFEMPEMIRPGAHALLPWPTLDYWLLRSSALYDLLNDGWGQLQEATGMVESYARYMERNLRDPNSANSREAFGLLRQFIERARAAGVPSGAVLFPNPGFLSKNYPFGYLHDRVRAVCAVQHITCLDLRSSFAMSFPNPQSMWISRFDPHPNARANSRAAQEILAAFRGVWNR